MPLFNQNVYDWLSTVHHACVCVCVAVSVRGWLKSPQVSSITDRDGWTDSEAFNQYALHSVFSVSANVLRHEAGTCLVQVHVHRHTHQFRRHTQHMAYSVILCFGLSPGWSPDKQISSDPGLISGTFCYRRHKLPWNKTSASLQGSFQNIAVTFNLAQCHCPLLLSWIFSSWQQQHCTPSLDVNLHFHSSSFIIAADKRGPMPT